MVAVAAGVLKTLIPTTVAALEIRYTVFKPRIV